MLDTETKRRIDTARDILVGKVPDPKSQVEQITIALIYKFMDDMDAESEEFGGERMFFAGEYARYGWAKLMRSGLGGHETLNLYAEAITKMPENPGIPPLFRDIFKNAFLPYRDPETLRSFLKVIDEFTYDHSERLGDAFEYLLSVLGSQGDAGQFRTPRHIIDFIVAIIDPKKNETVLDPACGTAGFLISSYKHILKANTDDDGNNTLTPDDKGRLAENFKGYDISPDMVRLSLVNMYLHGFSDPHIFEYDTLTSQDRWNEHADVILANPPFMSPKGGIRPHNRFSVQSKRSEVLFVDYMAEHLTPTGRAGIIVPEGIIFQSQTAYKQLRKMLVEDYLVAVISLPAGVFNPYSGVKTSILILDKSLAKKTNTIAFFKVENDGFGLGAQRRPIDKNDLSQVQFEVAEFLRRIREGQEMKDFQLNYGLLVDKSTVASNDEYNLSGERYRKSIVQNNDFPLVKIGDICIINPPKNQLSSLPPDTKVSFVPMSDLNEHRIHFEPKEEKKLSDVISSYTYFQDNDVLLARVTPCFENGKAGIARGLVNGLGFGSSEFYVLRPTELVLPEWIYFCVMHPLFRDSAVKQMTGTGGLQRVPKSYVNEYHIPLPTLDVQKEIVAEIEDYQKIINGARAVVDNYRPRIPIYPNWPIAELGDVCIFKRGPFGGSLKKEIFVKNGYAVYEQSHAISNDFSNFRYFITDNKFNEMRGFEVKPGDLIMSCSGTMGRVAIVPESAPAGVINQALLKLSPTNHINTTFLKLWMDSTNFQQSLANNTNGAAIKNVASVQVLKSLRLPLPPLDLQLAIVNEIEAEQALVDVNRELITRFEKKIQATIARIWGEDKPIPTEV
jgi:type I restriction enzyme M protein